MFWYLCCWKGQRKWTHIYLGPTSCQILPHDFFIVYIFMGRFLLTNLNFFTCYGFIQIFYFFSSWFWYWFLLIIYQFHWTCLICWHIIHSIPPNSSSFFKVITNFADFCFFPSFLGQSSYRFVNVIDLFKESTLLHWISLFFFYFLFWSLIFILYYFFPSAYFEFSLLLILQSFKL